MNIMKYEYFLIVCSIKSKDIVLKYILLVYYVDLSLD
jgi:hypothetical protein